MIKKFITGWLLKKIKCFCCFYQKAYVHIQVGIERETFKQRKQILKKKSFINSTNIRQVQGGPDTLFSLNRSRVGFRTNIRTRPKFLERKWSGPDFFFILRNKTGPRTKPVKIRTEKSGPRHLSGPDRKYGIHDHDRHNSAEDVRYFCSRKHIRIVDVDNFSISPFFNSTKVYIEQDMHSPAELHDKCNLEELSPELKCHLIDAFLTCRPQQCESGDRFRCDCNVYNHG